ncbi:MAG: threonine-phosphate decarboxylase CobD [Deltaproteobacteria bacterium]|nr:threonine-phosphate decarboxylase CobD [Deltaproteobacteria bacterium]
MGLSSFQPRHGGDLAAAQRTFGSPPCGWLDLSTGVNPWPYPYGTISPETLTRLPQDDAMAALLAAAREAYGIAPARGLAAAPGSQALFQLLPTMRTLCRVAVLAPTYDEHAVAWRRLGHVVEEVGSLGERPDADVVVVVNPNNPDGRTTDRKTLARAAEELARRGGWLVVDETFADVAPDVSLASAPGFPNTLIVRSFGKFFGLPGLRLGFVAGPPTLVDGIARRLGPWAVSGPALEIGRQALADTDWIVRTRARLAEMRLQLDSVLSGAGLTLVGGTDLFRLVETAGARDLSHRLGRAGILVRSFDRHPGWLRIGLPPSADALQRLSAELKGAW